MIHSYHAKGIKVGFIEVNSSVMDRFAIAGLKDLVGTDFFFESNQQAIDYIEINVIKTKEAAAPASALAEGSSSSSSSSSANPRDNNAYSAPPPESSLPTVSSGQLVDSSILEDMGRDDEILVDTADSDGDAEASPTLPPAHSRLLHSHSHSHSPDTDYMDPANNLNPY